MSLAYVETSCLVTIAFGERGAKRLGRRLRDFDELLSSNLLEVGYLRGADLWHLACALYLVEDPPEISFVTLDDRQRTVAAGLGFET